MILHLTLRYFLQNEIKLIYNEFLNENVETQNVEQNTQNKIINENTSVTSNS